MDIRKISVGPDYKSGAMHYIKGQQVLNGSHEIHLIAQSEDGTIKIWLENDDAEILLWKSFTSTMPVSIEYNIYF
jgi:hypothetical protein